MTCLSLHAQSTALQIALCQQDGQVIHTLRRQVGPGNPVCNPQDWWRAAELAPKTCCDALGMTPKKFARSRSARSTKWLFWLTKKAKFWPRSRACCNVNAAWNTFLRKSANAPYAHLVNADPAVDSLLAQVMYLTWGRASRLARRRQHPADGCLPALPNDRSEDHRSHHRRQNRPVFAAQRQLVQTAVDDAWHPPKPPAFNRRPARLQRSHHRNRRRGPWRAGQYARHQQRHQPCPGYSGLGPPEVGDVILEVGAGGHLVVITDKAISDRTGQARPMPHPFRDDRFLLSIRTGAGEQSLLRAAAKYDWPGGADLQLPGDLADSGPEGTYTDFWSAWADRCSESIGHLASLAHFSGRILLTGPLATPDIADRLSQAAGVNISMVHDEHLSARADTILANMLLGRADDLVAARAKVNLPEPVALEY